MHEFDLRDEEWGGEGIWAGRPLDSEKQPNNGKMLFENLPSVCARCSGGTMHQTTTTADSQWRFINLWQPMLPW